MLYVVCIICNIEGFLFYSYIGQNCVCEKTVLYYLKRICTGNCLFFEHVTMYSMYMNMEGKYMELYTLYIASYTYTS